MAVTLRGLGDCGIAHNDLKADNVVLRREEDRLVATTIDLGNASCIGDAPYHSMEEGRFPHVAPELRRGLKAESNSDAYSLGFMMDEVSILVPLADGDLIGLANAAAEDDPKDRISVVDM